MSRQRFHSFHSFHVGVIAIGALSALALLTTFYAVVNSVAEKAALRRTDAAIQVPADRPVDLAGATSRYIVRRSLLVAGAGN